VCSFFNQRLPQCYVGLAPTVSDLIKSIFWIVQNGFDWSNNNGSKTYIRYTV
jgi:hypothetical protein